MHSIVWKDSGAESPVICVGWHAQQHSYSLTPLPYIVQQSVGCDVVEMERNYGDKFLPSFGVDNSKSLERVLAVLREVLLTVSENAIELFCNSTANAGINQEQRTA